MVRCVARGPLLMEVLSVMCAGELRVMQLELIKDQIALSAGAGVLSSILDEFQLG